MKVRPPLQWKDHPLDWQTQGCSLKCIIQTQTTQPACWWYQTLSDRLDPFNAEFIFRKFNFSWHFLSLLNFDMVEILKIFPCKDDKEQLILNNRYHVCWLPGDTRSQGINRHGIDLVIPEYFGFSPGWVMLMCHDILGIQSLFFMNCSEHLKHWEYLVPA